MPGRSRPGAPCRRACCRIEASAELGCDLDRADEANELGRFVDTDPRLVDAPATADVPHMLEPAFGRGRLRAPGPACDNGPMLEIGTAAPDFDLPDQDGRRVRLADLRGRSVVLYFYPKDDTPGCTTQACGIRDAWGEFERAGAVVLGVSPDSEKSHVKFKEKFDLPFTLLADTDHAVAEAYGVWTLKKYMGREYMGVERTTFVIDADGIVAKVFEKVKPATHADDVLAALAA
jgi:peroxiredoxin Q/BCP